MITIPLWLFILLIVLAAPLAIILSVMVIILILTPLFALKAAAQADLLSLKQSQGNTERKQENDINDTQN